MQALRGSLAAEERRGVESDERIASLEGFDEYELEMVMALTEQVARFCEERMLPLNGPGDPLYLGLVHQEEG